MFKLIMCSCYKSHYKLCPNRRVLRFFPNEEFKCPCGNYPIKSRRHILHKCTRHNRYWNPRRDLLNHFIMFLIANPKVFAFIDNLQPVISSWTWNDAYCFYILLFYFYFSLFRTIQLVLYLLSISPFSFLNFHFYM